jgi:hypothetical protein
MSSKSRLAAARTCRPSATGCRYTAWHAALRGRSARVAGSEEAFELAQLALQSGAADALAEMSVRFAKAAGPLASLVRERQDLVARRQGEMRLLDAAAGRTDSKAGEDARAAVAALDQRLDAIDTKLANEYAELANPKPLTIAATRALLKPDEALVLFLDVPEPPQVGKLPEETLTWVMTRGPCVGAQFRLERAPSRIGWLRCAADSMHRVGMTPPAGLSRPRSTSSAAMSSRRAEIGVNSYSASRCHPTICHPSIWEERMSSIKPC